ncbi:flagellar biosynthetic protein FliO [Thiomicrorhabdus aquaedulcis]|uniref:flagellar biosynthetic protein FliO n=1 Tax=Thiomicrorhabdus aquaedulcis TaxID=2211106 RepID=UPI000FD94D9E|nr:flagellar biosynthetic protein FliO [Thiomicrorhabdus aquaedulcis]
MQRFNQAWLMLLSRSIFSVMLLGFFTSVHATEAPESQEPNKTSIDQTVTTPATQPHFAITSADPKSSSVTAPASTAAPTPVIGESASKPSDYFGQIMLSLVLVLMIIFLAAWLLRRYGRFPGVADGHLKVLGALSVGQRERILLLQVGSEQILVGVTTSKITTLHHLEEPVQVKDNVAISSQLMNSSFSQRLQEALKPKDATNTPRADT